MLAGPGGPSLWQEVWAGLWPSNRLQLAQQQLPPRRVLPLPLPLPLPLHLPLHLHLHLHLPLHLHLHLHLHLPLPLHLCEKA